MTREMLKGDRHELKRGHDGFPEQLNAIEDPPGVLYIVGELGALRPGLAVVGARKATPYGLSCARRFSTIAAQKGISIISGGARGCDCEAHRAAIEAGAPTVVFLGGGCDRIYPAENFDLFQRVIDSGGAVVSEWPWERDPRPFMFRARNRLIAGLSKAVLIVEAGMPSGTFSTADSALESGKDVLVVPGAITSPESHGSNKLLYQGATPVVDDESFEDVLLDIFGCMKWPMRQAERDDAVLSPIIESIRAAPCSVEQLTELAVREYGADLALSKLLETLGEAEALGLIARLPSGKWGPVA